MKIVGHPVMLKNVNYSSLSNIYGDYANGGEETSWAYGIGHGTRDSYVYYFEGCKELIINSLAGENNIGRSFVRISYSDITINNLYIAMHISYNVSDNKSYVYISPELSHVILGNIQIYRDENDERQLFNYYYDYPYNFSNGKLSEYLLETKKGQCTTRTPITIWKNSSALTPVTGNINIQTGTYAITTQNNFIIEVEKNSNYYIPVSFDIKISYSDNASGFCIIKGKFDGRIQNNNLLVGISSFQKFYGGSDYEDVTATISKNKILIPIPDNMRICWSSIESVGERVAFKNYLE